MSVIALHFAPPTPNVPEVGLLLRPWVIINVAYGKEQYTVPLCFGITGFPQSTFQVPPRHIASL
jgi:hypothetical protein